MHPVFVFSVIAFFLIALCALCAIVIFAFIVFRKLDKEDKKKKTERESLRKKERFMETFSVHPGDTRAEKVARVTLRIAEEAGLQRMREYLAILDEIKGDSQTSVIAKGAILGLKECYERKNQAVEELKKMRESFEDFFPSKEGGE